MAEFLELVVSSNLNTFGSKRRFPKSTKIVDLKGMLELLTGAAPSTMQIEAYNDGVFVCELARNEDELGSYPIKHGMTLNVVDKATKAGEFDDVSQVPKYEISSDDYAKRSQTARNFLKQKRENQTDKANNGDNTVTDAERKVLESMTEQIGCRCEVRMAGVANRRGVLRFVGTTHFKLGIWCGVEYDKPLGKNNGSVGGTKYFECKQKYGGFVKPKDIEIGSNFTPFDDSDEEGEM